MYAQKAHATGFKAKTVLLRGDGANQRTTMLPMEILKASVHTHNEATFDETPKQARPSAELQVSKAILNMNEWKRLKMEELHNEKHIARFVLLPSIRRAEAQHFL